MSKDFESILKQIHPNREAIHSIRELLLANTVMLGEISSPTFSEEERIRFLSNRFIEEGLHNISIDEAGNGMGVLPGKKGKKAGNILVCAHADTVFSDKVDHAMSVSADIMTGPGVGDNSLGLAAIVTLPEILRPCRLFRFVSRSASWRWSVVFQRRCLR